MRLLFTAYPGLGHVHPVLPLAHAAVRAGHEVAFATGPDIVDRIRSYGFEAWTAGLAGTPYVDICPPGLQLTPDTIWRDPAAPSRGSADRRA